MTENSHDSPQMSRVKSALVRGFSAATMIGSSLAGSSVHNPVVHEPISRTAGYQEGQPLSEHDQLKEDLERKYEIVVFDPAEPIDSTQLIQAFRRVHGNIPKNQGTFEDLNLEIVYRLIGDVQKDLGLTREQLVYGPEDQVYNNKHVIQPWSTDQLKTLQAILESLPPQFIYRYKSRIKDFNINLYRIDRQTHKINHPLELIKPLITKVDDNYGGKCGNCNNGPEINRAPLIRVSDDIFNGEAAAGALVHELTHIIVPPMTSNPDGSKANSEVTTQALRAIGFDHPQTFKGSHIPELLNLFTATGEIEAVNTSKGITYEDKTYIAYGTNSDEMMSVAADIYLFGKESFLKNYQRSLGTTRSLRLYDFMRSEFFGGKEFQKHEIMNAVGF